LPGYEATRQQGAKVGALQSLAHNSSYLDQEAGNRQGKAAVIKPQKTFRTAYLSCTAYAYDVVANPLAPVKTLYQTPLQLCTLISGVGEDIQSPAQQNRIGQKKGDRLGERNGAWRTNPVLYE
jgi:hypothetical protein